MRHNFGTTKKTDFQNNDREQNQSCRLKGHGEDRITKASLRRSKKKRTRVARREKKSYILDKKGPAGATLGGKTVGSIAKVIHRAARRGTQLELEREPWSEQTGGKDTYHDKAPRF